MKFPNNQMLNWLKLCFFVVGLLVMNPGGAVQVKKVVGVLAPVATLQSDKLLSVAVKDSNPKKREPHRCAQWASCKGQELERRVEKKRTMLLAMIVGLSLRS